MARVTLEIKKRNDGVAILTFVRPDGSRTSSSIGASAGFGPVHDLSHYAVESVLGIVRAFIGLCAEGWDIRDFEKGAARRLPPEALAAEIIAGEISRMEMMSQWSTLADFNWTIASCGVVLTAGQYAAIRERLSELRARWEMLAPGATMSLDFQ